MKLFNADGTPTREGVQKLDPVQKALNQLFKSDNVKHMTENQKRLLGGWLAKMVGDTVMNSVKLK